MGQIQNQLLGIIHSYQSKTDDELKSILKYNVKLANNTTKFYRDEMLKIEKGSKQYHELKEIISCNLTFIHYLIFNLCQKLKFDFEDELYQKSIKEMKNVGREMDKNRTEMKEKNIKFNNEFYVIDTDTSLPRAKRKIGF